MPVARSAGRLDFSVRGRKADFISVVSEVRGLQKVVSYIDILGDSLQPFPASGRKEWAFLRTTEFLVGKCVKPSCKADRRESRPLAVPGKDRGR